MFICLLAYFIAIASASLYDGFSEKEAKLLKAASAQPYNDTGALPLDRIYTYEEIYDYMDRLEKQYPNIARVVIAGYSFEGRPIKYLQISTSNLQDQSKPIVFLQSLVHAREYMTQSVTLYAIQKLVVDVTESELVNEVDWIILPIVNPDGYYFAHLPNNRYWTKNRSTGHTVANMCMGVDINRNFDVMWGENSVEFPCSDLYHGPSAASEPETITIGDIMHDNLYRLALFLDIQSFGSKILYGNGDGSQPSNVLLLHAVGTRMVNAINAVKIDENPNYSVGNVALLLDKESGSSRDYATKIGIPLSYTIKLPAWNGQTGDGGVLVDPEFIEQAGYETWEGIRFAAKFARDNYTN